VTSGATGQYDVLADGELVASRGNEMTRLLGGGWPDPEDVTARLRERLTASS